MSSKAGRKRKRGRRKKEIMEGLDMGRGLHKETIELINYIKEHIMKGEKKHVRRIYYALESRQKIVSSDQSYQKIKNILKQARFHGLIHPEAILLDKGRKPYGVVGNYSYLAEDVINAIPSLANWYSINKWDYNDYYIEVWQEKESLEPDFTSICSDYGIMCITGRGDQSITAIYHAMKRWKLFLSRDKKIKILYYGDFNPSGLHALVSIQNTVAKLKNSWHTEFPENFEKIEFDRVLLNADQVDKYSLPENPTKQKTHKDRVLAKKFIAKYGDRNVELESLAEHQPVVFQTIIRDSITDVFNTKAQEKIGRKVNAARKRLRELLTGIKDYYLENWEDFSDSLS